MRADAAIYELEQEVARLQCCGNCQWLEDSFEDCRDDVDLELLNGVNPYDSCHFSPSRWAHK